MSFSIRSFTSEIYGGVFCELLLGEYKQVFPLIETYWSSEMYQAQWMDSLISLTGRRVNSSVLIIDIQPSDLSVGVCYWALFREDEIVYLQERFSRELTNELKGLAIFAEMNIPPRIQGTPEEQAFISEWIVPIDDILKFLKSKNSGLV